MSQETMTTVTSMPLYLMIAGGVLIVIMIYLLVRMRRSKTSTKRSQRPQTETKQERRKLREERPEPTRRTEAKPEKPREETPRPKKAERAGKEELPVFENPIPETQGIDRESFSTFAGSRILAVDDNALNLKLIERLMEGSGIVMETASNGVEALEKLRAPNAHYDLVLMDVNMPKMDGLEATREIRQDPQLQRTPVLALTASTDREEVERILRSGMNGYLDKPIVLGKLFSAFKLFTVHPSQDKQTRVMVAKKGNEDLLTNPEVLDIRQGIEHSNNDEELYRTILDDFLREYAECDRRYQELTEQEAYEELHRLLVDLDGLTGTLGAMELYRLVDRIKQTLEQGEHALLKDFSLECHEDFQRFRREARRYLAA
ncbi:response regulator [Nitratifractor sp.]|uniref:response regulator n=1 Tax=Nitratifractor sp. TaxID=2268144 RepID=UPI0025F61A07|nr:response regulator [Nitratifractor sp.]